MGMEDEEKFAEGVRQRQKAVDAAKKIEDEAASVSVDADAKYEEARNPRGFRGEIIMPVCLFLESKAGVWLGILGGDKKEILRLEEIRNTKRQELQAATAKSEAKERVLRQYIDESIRSTDPAYKVLSEIFDATDSLFSVIKAFYSGVTEAVCTIRDQCDERDEIERKKGLIKIGQDLSFLQAAIAAYNRATEPLSDAGLKEFAEELAKGYIKMLRAVESANKDRSDRRFWSFGRLIDPPMELLDLVSERRKALDEIVGARIETMKMKYLIES